MVNATAIDPDLTESMNVSADVRERSTSIVRWIVSAFASVPLRHRFQSLLLGLLLGFGGIAHAQSDPDLPGFVPPPQETILAGALIIPMDDTNQKADGSLFNLKAYGLVNNLLWNNIPVKWAIKPGKAKDATDFTATAERVLPGALVPAVSVSFAGGPFIVPQQYAA